MTIYMNETPEEKQRRIQRVERSIVARRRQLEEFLARMSAFIDPDIKAWVLAKHFSPERLEILLRVGTPGLPMFIYRLTDLWECEELGGGFNHEIDDMTHLLQEIQLARKTGKSHTTFITERIACLLSE